MLQEQMEMEGKRFDLLVFSIHEEAKDGESIKREQREQMTVRQCGFLYGDECVEVCASELVLHVYILLRDELLDVVPHNIRQC